MRPVLAIRVRQQTYSRFFCKMLDRDLVLIGKHGLFGGLVKDNGYDHQTKRFINITSDVLTFQAI